MPRATITKGLSGLLLLDKPTPLPPIFPKAEEGGSSACGPPGVEPSPWSPNSDIKPPQQPSYAAAPRESLRVSSSSLASSHSKQNLAHGMRYPKPKDQSNTSLGSSGYAGDEENSNISLVGSQRIPRLTRRLNTQVSSSGLPSVSSSQASDQTSNSQSLSLSSQGQSAPSSNTNLQEDKIEGNLRISSEAIGEWRGHLSQEVLSVVRAVARSIYAGTTGVETTSSDNILCYEPQ
nr:protein TNT [Cavia porcellus]